MATPSSIGSRNQRHVARHSRRTAACILAAMISFPAGAAENCTPIASYDEGKVPVSRTSDGMLYFRADVDVNTDGTLASYHKDDLGHRNKDGKWTTNFALNIICHGVNIRRPNGDLLYSYRSCPELIKEFKRIRDFGWHRPGENFVDFYAIAGVPKTKLEPPAKDKGNYRYTPCEKDGYYVSQTARPIDDTKEVCDPARWVDSLRVPAIVMPVAGIMAAHGVKHHDLAIVRIPGTQKWVGAIIGDTNPSKIGEGTINLATRLKGMNPPKNYRQTVGLVVEDAEYFVFPGSVDSLGKLSNDSGDIIQKEAARLYEQHKLAQRSGFCPQPKPKPKA